MQSWTTFYQPWTDGEEEDTNSKTSADLEETKVVERVVEKIMHIRIQAWNFVQIFITMSYLKISRYPIQNSSCLKMAVKMAAKIA